MPVLAPKSYVEYRNDAYWVEGTRISLDSIVYVFQKGLSPESIVQSFPLLTLEQVYGAIAFYLANRAEIDVYLAADQEMREYWEGKNRERLAQIAKIPPKPGQEEIYAKLQAWKAKLGLTA